MENIITISNLNKTYDNGFQALKNINLEIQKGEIFALLGPNGAGKTSLISTICGISNATSGSVKVSGFDVEKDFRSARKLIGLVPQELTTDAFETVLNTVSFSRSLFGKPKNPEYIEEVLKGLSLWDKKDNKLMTLSGGMKRRVLIAKALSHEPSVLFLDEPSAGVDVELRKSMWKMVHKLRESGVTIILTTHYIEEAEEMSDRVGVISKGEIILTEKKSLLMEKLGKKEVHINLRDALNTIPDELKLFNLKLTNKNQSLVYSYATAKENNGVADLMCSLSSVGINFKDIDTKQSSLEEIFVELVTS